ncbi:ComEC/Rec2 family competence protein [Paenibacillus pini]
MKTSKITYIISAIAISASLLTGCNMGTSEDTKPVVTNNRDLRVIFLDVGQGASQLIITPSGKTMLIDAGNNDKEQTMINYLHSYGVSRLDVVIGSHPDADHIGGLDRVIKELPIGKIYMPKIMSSTKTFESVLDAVASKNLKVKTAVTDIDIDLDNQVKVQLLAPVKTYDDTNNMCAVVKITYKNTSFLLTADAESKSEQDMITSHGSDLKSDVMLVGHHGSKSSTTARFLNAVKPKIAVIQVGENKYGHPTKPVLSRLNKQGIEVYRNDLNGTVEIDSDGSTLNVQKER